MNTRRISIILIALFTSILLTGSFDPALKALAAQATTQAAGSDTGTIQTALPEAGSEATLRVYEGRSMVLQSRAPMKRVSVTDPAVASATPVTPTQLMIHGLKPGTVTLLLWNAQERMRSFDLQVQIDTRSVSAQLKQLFPDENIEVSQSGPAIVLNGEVASQDVIDKAIELGKTQASSVVSTMWVRPAPRDTIMLKVRFAEVDRSATQEMGVNFISTGAGNTIGSTSTQQFGNININDVNTSSTTVELNDLLNVFIFNPDINLGMFLKALQQKNLLQILAEPNLLAANGQEASFLAGGQFPFPIIQSGQGGSGNNAVTIEWKDFGIKLIFTADILDDGKIRLKLAPEVSSLDYANALTFQGNVIPALTTRKADTIVELENGQSFAIAGLLDNRFRDTFSKMPGLGDIPILGKLFQSKGMNKNRTELMVLVTPNIVEPSEPGQEPPLPGFPASFLDKKSFDKSGSGVRESSNAR